MSQMQFEHKFVVNKINLLTIAQIRFAFHISFFSLNFFIRFFFSISHFFFDFTLVYLFDFIFFAIISNRFT